MVEYDKNKIKFIENFYEDYDNIKSSLIKKISTNSNKSFNAQILLNQILFIKFLEKKGLLDGNKDYLESLYGQCKEKNKDFYKSGLKPLIIDILTKKHDFNKEIRIDNIKFGQVPHIGSDIFRNIDDIKKIKSEFWDELFQFFSKYRWSVEEENHSKTITPKVLGYIFEKTIIEEGHNSNASYFTPDNITIQICEDTIIENINNKLGRGFDFETSDHFKNILDKKELKNLDIKNADEILEKLEKIKILDNSCGSGAFIISALETIYKLKNALNRESSSYATMSEYKTKRQIMIDNLHGVDIQNEAIEMTKLRLWLSLISSLNPDEFKNINLPILNNFKTGNSLIGFTEIPSSEQLDLFNTEKTTIEDLIKEKNSENKSPKELRNQLKQKYLMKKKNEFNMKEEEVESINVFNWMFEFDDVLNHQNDTAGFDIIIGNPPYGNILSRIEKKILKNELKSVGSREGSYNAASIFIERSISLLKKNGCLGMIVPNTIARKDQFIRLRNKLLKDTTIFKIYDEGNPFKTSCVNLEMISIFIRNKEQNNFTTRVISKRDNEENLVNSEIFKKYDWFVLYHDRVMEKIDKNVERLHKSGEFFGAARPSDLKVDMSNVGDIKVAKGNCIKRFHIDSDIYITKNKNVKEYIDSLDFPLIILPEVSNTVKCAFCTPDIMPISGVMILRSKNNLLSEKYLYALLNSKIISYYFYRYIINKSHLTTHLNSTYLERLPVPKDKKHDLVEKISDYLFYLNKNPKDNEKLIKFVQHELLDPLFYTLYLDGLDFKELTDLIDSHLKNIEVGFNSQTIKKKNEREKILDSIDELKSDQTYKKLISNIENNEIVKNIENKISL